MTVARRPICLDCAHLELGDGYVCDAFPEGIPDEIFVDGFDHRFEYPGDKGIRFEPDEDAP